MGTGKLSGKPDEMLEGYLQWTSIPSRRSSITPSPALHAAETGISSGSNKPFLKKYLHAYSIQTLTFTNDLLQHHLSPLCQ